jgi:hypothetical protein
VERRAGAGTVTRSNMVGVPRTGSPENQEEKATSRSLPGGSPVLWQS